MLGRPVSGSAVVGTRVTVEVLAPAGPWRVVIEAVER
jgi:hypothetical protein